MPELDRRADVRLRLREASDAVDRSPAFAGLAGCPACPWVRGTESSGIKKPALKHWIQSCKYYLPSTARRQYAVASSKRLRQETVFGAGSAAMRALGRRQGTYLYLSISTAPRKACRSMPKYSRHRQSGGHPPAGRRPAHRAHIGEALVGAWRVSVGTKALHRLPGSCRWPSSFQGAWLVGIDAKDGKVATQGWLDVPRSRP